MVADEVSLENLLALNGLLLALTGLLFLPLERWVIHGRASDFSFHPLALWVSTALVAKGLADDYLGPAISPARVIFWLPLVFAILLAILTARLSQRERGAAPAAFSLLTLAVALALVDQLYLVE